jgi:2-keto-myo-inositol isomerase
MTASISRRNVLATGLGFGAATALGTAQAQPVPAGKPARTRFSLNASTIRPAPLEKKIEIAARCGYDGIELWSNELESYVQEGKSARDLGRRIADAGLCVPNVIGLFGCMPPEDARRAEAHEIARKRMELAQQVGSQCIAVIPDAGHGSIDLSWAAGRYSEFIAMARGFGLKAGFEFVGFFKSVYTLAQAVSVALQTNDRDACIVADTFHLFRGGSGFNGIKHLNGSFIHVFHFNDAPATKPREQQGDGDRLYPGDGHLPLTQLVRDLKDIGFAGCISLEIFKDEYWKQDPQLVAQKGLEKLRALSVP